VASPIPLDAPVMTTTFPSMLGMFLSLIAGGVGVDDVNIRPREGMQNQRDEDGVFRTTSRRGLVSPSFSRRARHLHPEKSTLVTRRMCRRQVCLSVLQ